ncbi:alpha/beta-hydrolase [Tricholoma matsutake]|nr:alpha/beta-hydrolase [Tricholoma matsutake 945]
MSTRAIFCILFVFGGISTVPAAWLRYRSTSNISTAVLSGFAPYTQFARAAYCPTSKLTGWKCGEACNATHGFKPTLIGGNGNSVQIYFVGYWPSQHTVVVAHEGTDPTKLLPLLTDAKIRQQHLDPALFPGVSSSVKVHNGFRNQHALTARKILSEVKNLTASKKAKKVACIGHSLGGALAELDALYFKLNLPAGISIKAMTYGTPRVGNTAFAKLIDSKVLDFKRINNMKDIIPIVPGRFMGFSHPQGEIHIVSPKHAVACSGNDDAVDVQCQIKTVPTIFAGDINSHEGPYDGIRIGTTYCT